MNKMRKINIFLVINIFLLLVACSKKEDVLISGDLVGFIELIDIDGNVIDDKSGVTVKIENTSHSSVTNADGRYVFSNLSAGTYSFTYSKEGYGEYKGSNYQYVGGNVPALLSQTSLYELPDFEVLSVDITYEDNRIDIRGTIDKASPYYIRAFIKDSANVSNKNYDWRTSRSVDWPVTDFLIGFWLNDLDYEKGEQVYVILYAYNPNEEYSPYHRDFGVSAWSSGVKLTDVISTTIE